MSVEVAGDSGAVPRAAPACLAASSVVPTVPRGSRRTYIVRLIQFYRNALRENHDPNPRSVAWTRDHATGAECAERTRKPFQPTLQGRIVEVAVVESPIPAVVPDTRVSLLVRVILYNISNDETKCVAARVRV